MATAEETARLARVQAVGDWLAELVALDGLKEDAHEWGPAIEATLAPGTRVGVSVSAWCLCRVWSCVRNGPTLCNCLSLAGSVFFRATPSNHLPTSPPRSALPVQALQRMKEVPRRASWEVARLRMTPYHSWASTIQPQLHL